jgi:integrase
LRSACEQARRWKLTTENPAADLPLPRADKREFRVWTPEEAQRFTSFCREDPAGLVFLVALTTGLRPSEYLALNTQDFDRPRSTLTITRTLERARGKWNFAETKRPRSRRTVSVPPEVARLIANHIDAGELGATRLLFESSTRGPIHERNLVQRSFKPLIERASLPDIRLYDLRHTFATLALREGVPARLVSEQLGHASVAFTLEVYGHVLEETRSVAAERLSQLLFSAARATQPVERETAQRKSA